MAIFREYTCLAPTLVVAVQPLIIAFVVFEQVVLTMTGTNEH